MADYAILITPTITETDAPSLDAVLKSANPTVKATSATIYTKPQVLILHCEGGTLTDAEIDSLRAVADAFTPGGA